MIESPKAQQNEKGYGNGVNTTPHVGNDVEQKMGLGKVLLPMNLPASLCVLSKKSLPI